MEAVEAVMQTSVQDFITVLNSIIDKEFPNTKRYIINGGDYVQDVVMELREKNHKLKYCPYQLYNQSEKYEDTIEDFVVQWRLELRK